MGLVVISNNKVSVQIVYLKKDKILCELVKVLKQERVVTYLINNGSVDEAFPQEDNLILIQNRLNVGFAEGHNLGFRNSQSDYILVLNPDIVLGDGFINELIKVLEQNPSVGMVCGKLLRCTENGQPTQIIDSTGIVMHKNRRAYDRGQGEMDLGQYDEGTYVFGCSGAAVLYRREMLNDIMVDGEYFDEEFFAYKEDVDLAWRAQLRGWKAYYTNKAVAFHVRGWQEGARDKIPRLVQIHSFKNRYLMLLKNDSVQSMLLRLPFILAYEIAVLTYVIFRRPYLLKGLVACLKLLPKMVCKRRRIQSARSVSDSEILQWFA